MLSPAHVLRSAVVTAIAVAALGCRNPLAVREGEEPIRTDRGEYVADRTGGGVSLDVVVRFTNPVAGPVNLPTCHGVHPPVLEKLVGGRWVSAYNPPVLACLGPPLVVREGDTLDYTYRIRGAPRGSNTYPQFEVPDVVGTYRLVWHIYDGDGAGYAGAEGSGRLLPLRQRVSNEFRIIE